MKKKFLLPFALLASATCLSFAQGIERVDAKVAAEYVANIQPIKITQLGDASLYEDNTIEKMVDGNDFTMAWFTSKPGPIVLDYGQAFLLNKIDVSSGIRVVDGNDYYVARDYYKGTIESSLDGISYEEIGVIDGSNHQKLVFNSKEVRYLRLVADDSLAWNAISEFRVNYDLGASVSYSEGMGLETSTIYTNLDYIIDDNNSTFAWFTSDSNKSGKSIVVSYDEAFDADYIELMMGKINSRDDYMNQAEIFYASDDEQNWVSLGTIEDGAVSYRYSFATPTTVKHIKMVATLDRGNGLVLREFSAKSSSPLKLNGFEEYTHYRGGAGDYPELLNNFRNAVDGNNNTYADLRPVASFEGTPNLVYDLGKVKKLNGFTLKTGGVSWNDYLVKDAYAVLISTNGIDFTNITESVVDDEAGLVTLENANAYARYIKVEYNAWLTICEWTVDAENALAKFAGQYADDFTSSKMALRFFLPVVNEDSYENYKVTLDSFDKRVSFNYDSANIVKVESGLQLSVNLGDIVNDYEKLITPFTLRGYNGERLIGEVSYSVMDITRQYLCLHTNKTITLEDVYYEFMYNLNNQIQKLKETATFEKVDPTVTFNYNPGQKFVSGGEEIATATVSPSNLNYTIHYSCDNTGWKGYEFPTEPETYACVVTIEGNGKYNSKRFNQWFVVISAEEELIVPEVTWVNNNGEKIGNNETFAYEDEVKEPTPIIPEGADYTIHYEKYEDNTVIEKPTEAGHYIKFIQINENEIYSAKYFFIFYYIAEPVNSERVTPTVTFVDSEGNTLEHGATFTIGDEGPSIVINPNNIEYEYYYSDANGVNVGTAFPTTAGRYSLVVVVPETETNTYVRVWLNIVVNEA